MTFDNYKSIIKSRMGKKRYTHSLNVAKAAQQLAIKYGADVKKAMVAGILHDITKEYSVEEQLQICKKFGIITKRLDILSPKTFHAKTAAALRILNQKIKDREMDKRYLAIVEGTPRPRDGSLKGYLFKCGNDTLLYMTALHDGGEEVQAETEAILVCS